jgi:hypothetical protein
MNFTISAETKLISISVISFQNELLKMAKKSSPIYIYIYNFIFKF